MMLQTLVENAIKHGISKEKNGGLVRIISDNRGNRHVLIVENTGIIQHNVLPVKNMFIPDSSGGFGIDSTQHRLQLMYGEKASFQIKNAATNLVRAEIALPVVATPVPH
jgi:two-component system LytT family sensor kinase